MIQVRPDGVIIAEQDAAWRLARRRPDRYGYPVPLRDGRWVVPTWPRVVDAGRAAEAAAVVRRSPGTRSGTGAN